MLEDLAAAAGAEVIAPELLFELLIAVNEAHASFHFRFGRESAPALPHGAERSFRHFDRG